MKFILFIVLFFVLVPWAKGSRPNVVVVFIDDMGWGDFSCFGNELAKTPHIDKLAQEEKEFNKKINDPNYPKISDKFSKEIHKMQQSIDAYELKKNKNLNLSKNK